MPRPEHIVEKTPKTYQHIRVVKTLASTTQPISKYQISKTTGISPSTVSKILSDLMTNDWTKVTTFKPVKYYLNQNNPAVRKFLEFLHETSYL
ncbi:MAG: hypothetical protein N3H84_06485 [Candidatus Caldarchaeum sp.]|nr:hypothetical protein [Candidatus Caldarchaeum sp.]